MRFRQVCGLLADIITADHGAIVETLRATSLRCGGLFRAIRGRDRSGTSEASTADSPTATAGSRAAQNKNKIVAIKTLQTFCAY